MNVFVIEYIRKYVLMLATPCLERSSHQMNHGRMFELNLFFTIEFFYVKILKEILARHKTPHIINVSWI